MMIEKKLINIGGGSLGIILDKILLRGNNAEKGDKVKLEIKEFIKSTDEQEE